MNHNTRKSITIIISSLILLLVGCGNDKAATKQTAQPTAQPAPVQQQQYQQAPAPQPQQQQATGVKTVTPQEAKYLIATQKDLLLIDVREASELSSGSIAGSQLIPFMQVAKGQHSIPRDKPLLIICAVGGRSVVAAQLLARRQGYKNVYNLKGGIDAWRKAGLPLQ